MDFDDQRFLEAAHGWIGLGNWHEANEELERISPQMRAHPDVLCVRWHIYAKAEKWEWAAEVARAISELVPADSFGPVHMAFALNRMNRPKDARAVLLSVVDKFPENYAIRYNLACYSCGLGNLREAKDWLKKAIELAGKKDVRKMALEDPALEPLWANIRKI